MNHQITIREFKEEDIDAVFNVIHRSVDANYTEVYPEDALRMYRHYHSQANILTDAREGFCVVAEEGGEIVGTGTLTDVNVRRVYIAPGHQGQGIGKKIYRALEDRALELKLTRLELGASLIAQAFWESQGFIFEKREDIPTPNGEYLGFFMMSKHLPEQTG